MLYGILVCYYEKYKVKAIDDFLKLLSEIRDDFSLIVVNNNHSLLPYENVKVIEIDGSNVGGEFSAWDEGLSFIKNKHHEFKDDDLFIFANDTFNHHRFFSFIDKYYFKKAIFTALNEPHPVLVGEVNSFGESFTIDGVRANGWVSTYLFSVNLHFLQAAAPFNMDDECFFCLVKNITTKEVVFTDLVSKNIDLHLNGWLFPSRRKHQWYGSKNASLELLKFKIKAIMNEKRLSVNLVKCKGEMKSVYQKGFASLYLKARNFTYRLFS